MNTPQIEVLYAEILDNKRSLKYECPVVRYSDHCAEMERNNVKVSRLLDKLADMNKSLEAMTATAERLQAELRVAKYSQQATNDMIANIPSGRWDSKPKAL